MRSQSTCLVVPFAATKRKPRTPEDPPGGQRRGARMHGNTAFLGGVQQLPFDIATRIDDGAHRRSGVMHGKQRMPPEIVVDNPGNPLSAVHRIAPGIRMDSAGQHDSGQVVVAEQHGLFSRAGRQHDASRAHLMESLHRAVASVGGAPVMDRHQVVVVAAGGRGIGHEPDVVHAIQLGKGRFQQSSEAAPSIAIESCSREPPNAISCSATRTSSPRRPASNAAARPEGPEPTTSTSQ